MAIMRQTVAFFCEECFVEVSCSAGCLYNGLSLLECPKCKKSYTVRLIMDAVNEKPGGVRISRFGNGTWIKTDEEHCTK
jgi:hypothetical protein